MWSPLDEAKYQTVHAYPGGAAKLATLAGMNYGTLCNKVNPGVDTHHLTVDESITLQHITQDFRILHAAAAALNHVCVPIADFSGVSDMELLDAYARYHADLGETAVAIRDTLADGRVSRLEYARVRAEFFDDFQRGLEFLARLEGLIRE